MNDFLPISKLHMQQRGWDECDFIMVTGDAYVDHPSFGAAVITRLLERLGFRVGIIAQPDWTSAASFRVLGKPRLAFLVTAGNIDSMVNNYTAAKKKRNDDVYAPARAGGRRPDRASSGRSTSTTPKGRSTRTGSSVRPIREYRPTATTSSSAISAMTGWSAAPVATRSGAAGATT